MSPFEIVIVVALLIVVALQILVLMRKSGQQDGTTWMAQLQTNAPTANASAGRSERTLREQVQSTAQATRQELGGNFAQLQQNLAAQLTSVATLQNSQIDAFLSATR